MNVNRQKEMELMVDLGYRDEDEPVAVAFTDDRMSVTLRDARIISTPLEWYPLLKEATSEQLSNVELSAWGVHWPDLDEDLSIRGMLMGWKAPKSRPKNFKPMIIEELPEDQVV